MKYISFYIKYFLRIDVNIKINSNFDPKTNIVEKSEKNGNKTR